MRDIVAQKVFLRVSKKEIIVDRTKPIFVWHEQGVPSECLEAVVDGIFVTQGIAGVLDRADARIVLCGDWSDLFDDRIARRGIHRLSKGASRRAIRAIDADALLDRVRGGRHHFAILVVRQPLVSTQSRRKRRERVIGVAQPGKGVILSTPELGLSGRDRLLVIQFLAMHEVGHMFGLPHCMNRCVMRSTYRSWMSDKHWLLVRPFCRSCEKRLCE